MKVTSINSSFEQLCLE